MPKESRLPGEGNAQRLKMLYLRDIFLKYTNENQSLTRQQIEEKLADLGVSEGRKAFAEDIEALRQYGMDIQSTNGRTASYQLMSRDFELAELKLIADVISSSKFLTYNQSAELLHKIENLCCDCDAMQLRRNVFVTGAPSSRTRACFTTWTQYSAPSPEKTENLRYRSSISSTT